MSEKRVGELSPEMQSDAREAVKLHLQASMMQKEADSLKAQAAALSKRVMAEAGVDRLDLEGEGSFTLLPPMPNPISKTKVAQYLVVKEGMSMDQVENMWGEVVQYREASIRYNRPRAEVAGAQVIEGAGAGSMEEAG